jgi:hypothetical protein
MSRVEQLKAKRKRVLAELAGLEQIRRGTVVEQFVQTRHKDGSKVRRGPYPLYSFKEKGKTVSRRVTEPAQVEVYRQQIQAFRRFRELISQLVTIGEQLSDVALSEDESLKKTLKSRLSKTRK